jgi:aldehyde:ferredoxin oxidoreductase
VDLLNAFTGQKLTGDDLMEQGKDILKMERDFNMRAGFTNKDDRLPEYMKKEKLPPHNITFQVTDEDLDQLFNF